MESEVLVQEDRLPYPFASLRDVFTALFRQKVTIFVIFTAIFLGVLGWVYTTEILYEARAILVLKFGREHIFRPEIGKVDQIVQFNEKAAVESERKIIKSKDLVRRVVEAMGVEKLYPDLLDVSGAAQAKHIETATSRFIGKLDSISTEDTNLLEIVFLHEQPKVASEALNLLVEFLKERHLQVFSDPKASFLVQRLEDYQKDLEKTEHSLQAFKHKHDLSSPLVDQQRRLLDQRAHLDTNHKTINNQLQGLVGKIKSLDSQLEAVPVHIPLSTTEAGGNLAKAKADLFKLKRQEQTLLTKYTEQSSPIQNIKSEIALVEQFIRSEASVGEKSVTSGKNPVFQKLEISRLTALSELKTLQARNQVIDGQIRDLDQKIHRLDVLREELGGLERMSVTAEGNYQLYVKKVEEAKVSEEMDQLKMSNIGVIQSAEVPQTPAGRSRLVKTTLGAIIAAIMSIGLGLVFEFLHGNYVRPEQAAEDLELPILASFAKK